MNSETNEIERKNAETFAGLRKEEVQRFKTMRFSAQQKQILLWLYAEEQQDNSLLEREKAYLEGSDGSAQFFINYIPWSARRLLDDEPTNNQSAALSRSLKSLEDRGLVLLGYSSDEQPSKRRRTSKVAFTDKGRLVAENLKAGYVVRESIQRTTYHLFEAEDMNRWTALGYAIQTLKKEKRGVQAALEVDTAEAYSALRVRDRHSEDGEIATDRVNIRIYYAGINKALETLKQEYDVLDNKITDAFLLLGAKEVGK